MFRLRVGEEFHAVAERIGDEASIHIGKGCIPLDGMSGLGELANQYVERRAVGRAKRRMSFGGGPKVGIDTNVNLLAPDAKPHPTTIRELIRLRDRVEPEEVAVEALRLVFASGRGGDLDVIEIDDHVPLGVTGVSAPCAFVKIILPDEDWSTLVTSTST